ncbi:MAG TPA: MBL fold metallo-hydrolase [Caulobacterales bacterium]|nr:MBL fold metallo-hydrolase [Caulobacterales bacterium]
MQVRFWGTRGSIATPGPTTVRYGGNTSCVELRPESGELILIDCGTGAHALGQALKSRAKACSGHILISHTHWDHIQGLPFFAPLFVAGNEWHIYGPRGLGQSLKDVLAGQMEYAYFPVALNAFAATVHFHEVVEGGFQIGDVRIATHYLNHPALTVGYRIEADGATLVYASDHEPHSPEAGEGHAEAAEGGDLAHIEFIRDADLLIHDAQYTAAEYPGKIGWGHSTVEYVIDMAAAANVRHVALYHHDPARTDEDVDKLIAAARTRALEEGSNLLVTAAAEGETLELRGRGERYAPYLPSSFVNPADNLQRELVLIAAARSEDRELLLAAAKADGIPALAEVSMEKLKYAAQHNEASLIFIGDAPDAAPLTLCRALRDLQDASGKETPIILIADQAHVPADRGEDAGVTDWLTRPYSLQYARSRMRAWLMRSMFRWRKAALPQDEEERVAAVHKLGLLDTAAEERFDRHARIAAAALDVPIALVTLVDRDRQWFKSHLGFDFSETPRDIGFCAHTILDSKPLVVNDALRDDRFADNAAVVGDPRVRFYAGVPLRNAEGARVGAFCIVDHKPRNLSAAQLRLLQDLARLVEDELAQKPSADLEIIERKPIRTS